MNKRSGLSPIALGFLFLLGACGGAKSKDLTLTITGVNQPDLDAVRGELEKISDVSDVRTASFADGTLTITLRYKGTGGDLAGALAKSLTLKNVTGFDDGSVHIAMSATPVAPKREPEPKREEPLARQDPPPPTEAKKDPLAYRTFEWSGGSIAVFDNWKAALVSSNEQMTAFNMSPNGREKDFALWLILSAPNAQTMERFFVDGPQMMLQYLPGFTRIGEQKECRFGGDEARAERYEGTVQGRRVLVQAVYIKKKDIAVLVMGNGTEESFQEFGRSVEIVAQSIGFKESPVEPGLVGTWVWESRPATGAVMHTSYRYVTLYPNGTFTDISQSATAAHNSAPAQDSFLNITDGGGRGKIVKRGNLLTFHYDNGKTWNATYELKGGNGLVLNGALFIKQ